jgi:glyoxylase-like metal-dependent hydrolase (beta-lactamase superfamily II)
MNMLVQVGDRIHRMSGGVTNIYLIEESGKYTIVDAGAPKDWALLVSSLQQLGAGVDSLDAVLLTHAHVDHVGFAEQARNDAGASVWIHEADAEAARTGKVTWKNEGKNTSYLFRAEFWRTALSLTRRGAIKAVPIKEVSSFTDGEVIDVPGSPRAVHTPGHTPGSAAIFAEKRSVLLTGDAMCTWNAYTGRTGPQIMPSALNMSNAECMASLDRLAAVQADVILPGHGDPWTGGVPEAVARAKSAGPS